MSGGRRNKLSFDALGKGLSGRDLPAQNTFVRSGRSKSDDDSYEEIEFATRGKSPEAEDRIQVFTVVEQEVQKGRSLGRESDSESMRELVSPPRAVADGGRGRGGRGYHEH